MLSKYNIQTGFTVVELLIVIATIGILAGVLIAVINPQSQQEYAEDGVLRQNLSDTLYALETYYSAERSYPAEGTANDPLDVSAGDRDIAAIYLSAWPAGYVYNLSGGVFSVHVVKASSNDFFKYNSNWKEIRECASTTNPNDVADCD